VRLTTALSGVALVLAAYLCLRGAIGEGAARWTALMLLASPYFLEHVRFATLDTPLSLAVFLAIMALYHAWQGEGASRWGWAALAGLALGAATLLKGPAPYLYLLAACLAAAFMNDTGFSQPLRRAALATVAVSALASLIFLLGYAGITIAFPVALALFIVCWIAFAALHARTALLSILTPAALAALLAVLLSLPWVLLLLQRYDWAALREMLGREVVERTYAATEINSGSPFFYLIMLPALLAPWGLLLPFHVLRRVWGGFGPACRFAALTGWLSIALFSLIAGKEHEYIMPAFPWLLVPIACLLDRGLGDAPAPWAARWLALWTRACLALLVLGAFALPVYALFVKEAAKATLLVELALLAVAAAAALWLLRRRPGLERVAILALVVISQALLLTRSFHYNGDRSVKQLAQICRDLAAAGHTVEASRIFPHFAFYVERPIRENLDVDAVRSYMGSAKPYFYLTRESLLKEFNVSLGSEVSVIAGPIKNKDLMLLANPAGAEAWAGLRPAAP
jgi:4-amino-4-deoxy-L-arabinose transferase-like glycosyltransferase